ncbi:hypothetical protein HDU91_000618 [Kappamyces sp. JEL0680]|nr:hypothetical protein HDU91_000618 [Kappamyces sp. JEL0680]
MLVLFLLSSLVFIATGLGQKLTFFTVTSRAAVVVMFFIWGNNQIALAFFFSTLFNKSRTALIFVFILVLCSVIVSLAIEQLFEYTTAPTLIFMWPPFAFYRALGLANRASFDATRLPIQLSDLFGRGEIASATYIQMGTVFLYFALAFYFDAILPSEFGVKKPWYFPIAFLWRGGQGSAVSPAEVDETEVRFEDQDVKDERARVLDPAFDAKEYPLVMKNMRKVYAGRGGQGPKLAVKDVTIAVEKGITFGLLGPNGAGKSTLISILTGLYGATSGEATLAGFNIRTETAEVYKSIGICPQFDILWDELTVGEHLYFYARLKGIVSSDEQMAVAEALAQVSLTAFENRLTKSLSGGEKRRVSIAIALLGTPKVVFLDEPTTGLDPEVRRLIWDIVNNARVDRTIVLTTHSMEEAEALCQRIGIMAKGTLRCLADQLRLKDLYGTGFKIYTNSLEKNTPAVAEFLELILPNGWRKIDSFATNISYEFPAEKGSIARLFKQVEEQKDQFGILDWGIGQTTLEEVFVRLISEADASAEY